MLRFLVDAGVGRSVERVLAVQHDVLSVLDLDPHMPDQQILKLAHEQQRIIVTMDKDFGELIFKSNHPHHGVLLLRLEGAAATEKAEVVKLILERFEGELAHHFSTYQNGHLRIRKREN